MGGIRDISTGDLKQKSVRGAVWTFLGQGGKLALQFVSVVVLARLLTPQDFGLVGLAGVFINFLSLFEDLGLTNATIQNRELTQERTSALFWINTIVAVSLTAICCACAPFVAGFYEEPRLTMIVVVSSLGILMTGISNQHAALLQRRLEMKSLAYREIAGRVCSLGTAVVCALCGMGYWSLVFAGLAGGLSRTVLIWHYSKWTPSLVSLSHGKQGLRFGLGIAGSNLMNYISRNTDTMLIGKFHPAAFVGYYSKAYQMVQLPIQNVRQPITSVALSALSKLQDDPVRFRNYYRKIMGVLAILSMAPMAFVTAASEECVAVFLGQQWMPACTTFMILSFGAIIRPTAFATGLTMIASGRSGHYFLLGLSDAVLLVAVIACTAPIGIEAVALGYAVYGYAMAVPRMAWACYRTHAKWYDFLAMSWRPFLGAMATLAAGIAAKRCLLQDVASPLVRLVSLGAICLATCSLFWLLIPGGRRTLLLFKQDTVDILRKKRQPA